MSVVPNCRVFDQIPPKISKRNGLTLKITCNIYFEELFAFVMAPWVLTLQRSTIYQNNRNSMKIKQNSTDLSFYLSRNGRRSALFSFLLITDPLDDSTVLLPSLKFVNNENRNCVSDQTWWCVRSPVMDDNYWFYLLNTLPVAATLKKLVLAVSQFLKTRIKHLFIIIANLIADIIILSKLG